MKRLAGAGRVFDGGGKSVGGIQLWSDWSFVAMSNIWDDLHGDQEPIYVVQTNRKAIIRCILMTTDPGDLVLDPTCGSGTTSFTAEQLGRRWIAIDTSRVALSVTRQRLLTSKFDYYELAEFDKGPSCGFVYKRVPHITLKSIAQNQALDPIFAKWETVLAEKLATLNLALSKVTQQARSQMSGKLAGKERKDGKNAITDADKRRWLLPKSQWQEWEVPFDADPDYPDELRAALAACRRRQKYYQNDGKQG